jgi:cation transport ATPase
MLPVSFSTVSSWTLLTKHLMQVTLIHLEDRPRPGVFDVIQELQDEAKFRVMMLTGDHEYSAKRVATAVGINEFYCNLKPEDKLSHVKDISRDMGEFLDLSFFIFYVSDKNDIMYASWYPQSDK